MKMKIRFLMSLCSLFLIASIEVDASAAGPAARAGDSTSHGGVIMSGAPTVLIGGKPAARVGDQVLCPLVDISNNAPLPHIGGPISSGVPTVLIGGLPAATVGDVVVESNAQSSIAQGAATVIIGTSSGGL